MKTKPSKLWTFILFTGVLLVLLSCTQNQDEEQDATTTYAENLVNQFRDDLRSQPAELSAVQADFVKEKSLSELEKENMMTSKDAGKIGELIAKSVLISLGFYEDLEIPSTDSSPDNENQRSITNPNDYPNKTRVIKAANSSLVKIIIEKQSDAVNATSLSAILIRTIEYISSAGITGYSAVTVLGLVFEETFAAMGEKEVEFDVMASAAVETASLAVEYLGAEGAEIFGALMPMTLKSIISSTLNGMHRGGCDETMLVDTGKKIADGIVSNLAEAGITSSQLIPIIDAVKDGITDGFSKSGISYQKATDAMDEIEANINNKIPELIDALNELKNPSSIIEDIHEELVSLNASEIVPLTDDQLSLIKNQMTSDISQEGLQNSSDLTLIYPQLVISAETILGTMEPSLNDDEKLMTLENFMMAVTLSFNGRVSDSDLSELLEQVVQTSIKNLNLLQLTDSNRMFEATNIITGALIASLNQILLGSVTESDAIKTIVKGAVSVIDELGLDQAGEDAILSEILTGAYQGIMAAELSIPDTQSALEGVAAGAAESAATNSLEAGLTGSDLTSDIADAAGGIIASLAAAGAPTDMLSEVADEVITSQANILSEEVDAETLGAVLEASQTSISEGLTAAGATREEIESAEQAMAQAADEAVSNQAEPGSPDIVLSTKNVSTTEGETEKHGIFKVSLDLKPSETVTITLTSMDLTEGGPFPSILTFDATNWNREQEVQVRSADDGLVDEAVKYTIKLVSSNGKQKSVTVTNADNDSIGIDVTPNKKQYTSEAGGRARFYTKLKSQPKDNILVGWSIQTGQSFVDIKSGRYMIFTPGTPDEGLATKYSDAVIAPWNSPIMLLLQGKDGGSAEHESVNVNMEYIISLNYLDSDYAELTPSAVSVTNLDVGAIMRRFGKKDADEMSVQFSENIFDPEDNELIYENVLNPEYIVMKYAAIQERPQLVYDNCISTGNRVMINDGTTDTTIIGGGFDFCLRFAYATTSYAETALKSWGDNGPFSGAGSFVVDCQDGGNNTVLCDFSGSVSGSINVPGSTSVIANTMFGSEGIGNLTITIPAFSKTDSSPHSYTAPATTTYPQSTLVFRYKPFSTNGATNTAIFIADSVPDSGFWVKQSFTDTLFQEDYTLSATNFYYVEF